MKHRRLAEALGTGPRHTATWDMDVVDSALLIEFADAWSSLGDAVQDQIRAVMADSGAVDVNPNALLLAQERIGQWHEDIDEARAAALAHAGGLDDGEDDGSLEYAARVNGMR